MKFVLGLIFTALAGALLSTSIYASSYTIKSNAMPSPLYHSDVYKFVYTPGEGWVLPTADLTGNDSTDWESFRILADDGSTGQIVDVSIKLSCSLTAYYAPNQYVSQTEENWDTKRANFAGFDSGIVDFPLLCGSNLSLLNGTSLLTGSFFDGTALDLTLNAQAVVGASNSMSFHFEHGSFCPAGLQVLDETQPAAFAVLVYAQAAVSGIEVHDVPENVSTFVLLLGISIPCLSLLRRKARRA